MEEPVRDETHGVAAADVGGKPRLNLLVKRLDFVDRALFCGETSDLVLEPSGFGSSSSLNVVR